MRTSLVMERLERVPVSITLTPALSMLALITDALSGRARGAPESWRRLVRSTAAAQDDMVVRSLAWPGFSVLPDVVLPGDFTQDLDVPSQVAMLHEAPPDTLLAELEVITRGTPPVHWREAVDDPKRWLHGYADLVEETWTALCPLWTRMRPLLDREVERVAVATARRSLDVVLDDLHGGCSFRDGTFSFPDFEPERFTIGSRGLVLMPMLAGPDALIARLDSPDAVWIGYPLPGLAGALADAVPDAAPTPRQDMLAVVMGEVRARILAGLDRPLTMGTLARRVQYAPSVVTYHCDRLESAGLIARRRDGREIHVQRTGRGSALVELFSA
ncbi:winged helix-turn-helix transcriptional regulator [Actinomadura barringtoniae]|uniref:Winged helix-turn-helix transcriptional regulator n=1 Tax=Actinomadura barringtoniae TaxID=1427535 RepID=A0A939P6R2_9ACTN|nr:winged helix-turn-helix domain-containing protein [Actinomadura barringtoniae]MBO2446340.1 winged helix-turn-helix transcriptional regulator [Actinomadura barringtoniae]